MSATVAARRLTVNLAKVSLIVASLGLGATTLFFVQAALARRAIGTPDESTVPTVDGTYGSGPGAAIRLGFLGDSTAAGLGAHHAEETASGVVASGLAAMSGRRVGLTSVAKVGATSFGLRDQVSELLRTSPALDVAVILIGGNDVTHRVNQADSVAQLRSCVMKLRATGAEVVVGTCPDLGTIRPVHPPLRWAARHFSRELAAAQTIAVIEAGGRTVSMGDLLGPEFEARPRDLFSADKFHPSAAGYARCGSALLPAVCAAARVWTEDTEGVAPPMPPEQYAPVNKAASDAVSHAGTQVVGTDIHGRKRGIAGRWARLRRLADDHSPTA